MAERSNGGRSRSERTSSASTRPRASVSNTSSAGRDGVWARTISSASSTGITATPSLVHCSETGIRSVVREARVVPTVMWEDGAVVMIDQRRLPDEQVFLRCRHPHEVAEAIRDMAIRGAPAIGVAAAFGLAPALPNPKARGQAPDAAVETAAAGLPPPPPPPVHPVWATAPERTCSPRTPAY